MSLPTIAPDYIEGRIIDIFESEPLLASEGTTKRINYVVEFPTGARIKYYSALESTDINALYAFKEYGVLLPKDTNIAVLYLNNEYIHVTYNEGIGEVVALIREDLRDGYLFIKGDTFDFASELTIDDDFEISVKFSCVISNATKTITKIEVDGADLYYYIADTKTKVYDGDDGWVNAGYKALTATGTFVIKDDEAVEFFDSNEDD